MLSLLRQQPRAFRMVFMLEIWERFGYYTMQGILTLYFIRQLGFSDADAYVTFGAFFALVYGMAAMGGYLGDHVLGTKRAIVLGLITLALGYLSLALTDNDHVFWALGLVCVGNGIFKANPSNLLSKCYQENDPRLHSGFTLYYMAINLGSIFSLFVGPTLASRYGYPYAYFASFVGLIMGLANYGLRRQSIQHINTPADQKRIGVWQWGLVIVAIIVMTFISSRLLQHVYLARKLLLLVAMVLVAIYFMAMHRENQYSRVRMLVAFVLMVEAVVFFVLYQQMPTSLNLFAVNNVTPSLFRLALDPQSLQVLNPLWIVVLSPVLAMGYNRLNQRGYSLPIPYKFAVGMLCCGLSFSLLFFARFFPDENGMVSAGWLVMSYLFQSSGELLVSALGVAMVAELVPQSITGFVMGMWFLTSSMAGFIGAAVASYTALPKAVEPGIGSLLIYTKVFAVIGGVTLSIGLLMLLIAAPLSRYTQSLSKG